MVSCDGACNKLLRVLWITTKVLNSDHFCDWLAGVWIKCITGVHHMYQTHTVVLQLSPRVTRQPQCCRILCVQSWVISGWGTDSTGEVKLPSGKQCLPLGERRFLPVEQEHWHTARNWGWRCAPPAASLFVTATERQSITACLCVCGWVQPTQFLVVFRK